MGKEYYSLSFGASLFAGMINDTNATAFHYMRKPERDAYAFVLTPNAENSRLFHCPPFTPLETIFGREEIWHNRTKVPNQVPGQIHGIQTHTHAGTDYIAVIEEYPELANDLKLDAFLKTYEEALSKAEVVSLKPAVQ